MRKTQGKIMIRITGWAEDACSSIPSEDVLGSALHENKLTVWAIDGGSTLTEAAFTTFPDKTDSRWFADELSRRISMMAAEGSFALPLLADAIADIRHAYLTLVDKSGRWFHPVAACVIAEMREIDDRLEISLHSFADCFFMWGTTQLKHNHTRTQLSSRSRSAWKACSGFRGKRLEQLRKRREEQQRNEKTSALSLNPKSAFNCVETNLNFDRPTTLLLGTDGLARAWQRYALLPECEVIDFVAHYGISELIDRIREYEADHLGEDDFTEKRADDAAGMRICFVPHGKST
ncbi:hypothetical protein [Caballeronia sp. LZ001]|uniref:hypothetical protein n=1 Tax=Caballeronia sp. LZ001 TaxID=3038553 RepID=UPI00285877D2|nr:hypothetical protein [Caballeronia sp. LZ001]MDR5800623.1 hypothetical protein [Caballeronia sp. LZ001]